MPLNVGTRYRTGQPRTVPAVDLPGILADYRFDERSGTVLRDYSGRRNHGALGAGTAAPTWGATGLTFSGAQRVTSPVPPATVFTVMALVTQTTADATYQPVCGSDANAGTGWWLRSGPTELRALPGGLQTSSPLTAANGSVYSPSRCLLVPGEVVTWVLGGAPDKVYLGPDRCGDELPVTSAPRTAAGTMTIGAAAFSTFFKGIIHRLILCSGVASPAQVAAGATILRAYGASRGITRYQNTTTSRVLIAIGDSIAYGFGLTSAWPSTMVLANSYERWNLGISGLAAQQLALGAFTRVKPFVSANSPKTVFVFHAGTNDFPAGRTAAQIFADHQTAATALLTYGNVVFVPMLSRIGRDANKNSLNALLAAWSLPSGAVLVPEADLPHLVPDNSYSNTTYFQADGTHLTNTGRDELAVAIAARVDALG